MTLNMWNFAIIFIIVVIIFYIFKSNKRVPLTKRKIIRKKEDFSLNIPDQLLKIQKTKGLLDVDLLERPNYSKERTLVVDPSDEAFYRSHFKDFADNGFEGYGLNAVEKETINAIDISEPTFATFDKNELGYLGTDSQNVHSSSIQDTIKEKYIVMKKNKESKDNCSLYCKKEIIEYAKKNGRDYLKIKDILEQIEKRNARVSKLSDTEVGVLQISWENAKNKENVKIQILNELEDLTDNKAYIVCPSGVTSRIINANVVENPESGPQREFDLHTEMMNTASHVRTQLLENPDYNLLSEDEQTQIFKTTLIKKFENDYSGVIPKAQVQKELDSWIDYI